MTVILWIVALLLWSILLLVVGAYSGWQAKAQAVAKEEPRSTFNQTVQMPEIDSEVVRDHVMKAVDKLTSSEDWLRSYTGPRGLPGPGIEDQELDNGMTVKQWIENTDSRLTRVERKAGMSV